MSQTLADDSEVVFEQPGKSAGAMEQEGLVPSRRKEETWLEDTQPHQGARRRAMEFDRPVDEELGAALGGVEDEDSSGVAPGTANSKRGGNMDSATKGTTWSRESST